MGFFSVKSKVIAMRKQTALERQDLSRTYLAHHELESDFIIFITLVLKYKYKIQSLFCDHSMCLLSGPLAQVNADFVCVFNSRMQTFDERSRQLKHATIHMCHTLW
jgi:hypothetical protein